MGREIEQYRIRVHNKILKLRAIERILLSDDFEIAFKNAPEDERDKVVWILKTHNLENLKSWVHRLNQETLETMSSRKLKTLAKNKSIPYWSRMNKQELIEALHATGLG